MTRQLFYVLLLAVAVLIPRAVFLRESLAEASDDDYRLVRGLEFLHRDGGLVNRELNDPPLGEAIEALPLWFMGGTTHGVIEGTALYGQSGYSPETALMAVAIWKSVLFLPLLAVVFAWCRRLYGLRSAWLACAILLVEPTIAGHLPLASLDVMAMSGVVIGCYFGWRAMREPTVARVRVAALTCAVALLLKHTAILLPLIVCLYGLFEWLRRRQGGKRILRTVATAGLLTAFFIWALTAFDFSPAGKVGAVPAGLYVKSVLDARGHVSAPNDAYLFGQIRRGGWWYYFPAVAFYKAPMGVGVLLVLGLLSVACVRPRWDELPLFVALAAYAVFLMLQSIDIGWRHALPAYVFALILASRCVATGRSFRARAGKADPEITAGIKTRTHGIKTRTQLVSIPIFFAVAGWCALALTAVDAARWHPDYIAYVNWPRRDVYLKINDSNVDWGQGLKQANRWLDTHRQFVAGRTVYLRASAVSNRAVRHYLGGRVLQLHYGDVPPRHGVLIVSPVCLSGLSESADEYAFLRGFGPDAEIGHALRVYDLDARAH